MPSVEFNEWEISSSIVQYKSLHFLLAVAFHNSWKRRQLGVKLALLFGELKKNICMCSLPVYEKDNIYWKIKKWLYDLKQSVREWYKILSCPIFAQEFVASNFDTCAFVHTNNNFYISVCGDNITLFGKLSFLVENTIQLIKKDFEFKYLGVATWLLGIHIQ